MPRANARPGDLTGRTRAEQQDALVEELRAREGEIALSNAAKMAALENEVVDMTGPLPEVVPAAEVELTEVDVQQSWEVIGPFLEDLPDTTFGAGNHRSFEAGKKYKVNREWASHLREKGYVR